MTSRAVDKGVSPRTHQTLALHAAAVDVGSEVAVEGASLSQLQLQTVHFLLQFLGSEIGMLINRSVSVQMVVSQDYWSFFYFIQQQRNFGRSVRKITFSLSSYILSFLFPEISPSLSKRLHNRDTVNRAPSHQLDT